MSMVPWSPPWTSFDQMMIMMMILSTRPWSGGAYLKIGLWESLSSNILNNLNQIVDKDNDDDDEVGYTPRTMF